MKGIVYKIELDGEVYVGSTTRQVNTRQAEHNYQLKKGKNSKLYGFHRLKNKKIKCVWVCDVEYQSLSELRAIEEEHRKKLNANLNSQRAFKTQQDAIDDEKNRVRDWVFEYKKEKLRVKVKHSLIKSYLKAWSYGKSNQTIQESTQCHTACGKQNMVKLKPQRPRIECDVCKCIVEKGHIKRHKNTIKCMKIKSNI